MIAIVKFVPVKISCSAKKKRFPLAARGVELTHEQI